MEEYLYEILQVSPNAEQEIIEAAYKRLARKYHPDIDQSKNATQKMQSINLAYETLRNPITRAEYDRLIYKSSENKQQHSGEDTTTSNIDGDKNKSPNTVDSNETISQQSIQHQPSIMNIVYASILLFGYYASTWLIYGITLDVSTFISWVTIGIFLVVSILLAIIAAAGWDPNKMTIWRVLVLFLLTIFPILTSIPCYFAGKLFSRKISNNSISNPPKFIVVLYFLIAAIIPFILPTRISSAPQYQTTEPQYNYYTNTNIGIKFEHPSYITPTVKTTQERTEMGTIFTIFDISGQSPNPTFSLFIRIINDPARDLLYPELYPPSDESLKLLAFGDMVDLNFSEDEISQEAKYSAEENAIISSIAGYPAAHYTLSANDTSKGDLLIEGAFFATEKWDVSIILIASVEPGVEGSLSPSSVKDIWNRITSTMIIN